MKPSVHRKSAIGKRPGWAVHQSDFVRQTTGEDDQLILARYDVAIILSWNISVLPSRVVDSQFSPAKFLRLAVEEIHKCDLSRRDFLVGIVVVPAEEITVIAGRDLRLHAPPHRSRPVRQLH